VLGKGDSGEVHLEVLLGEKEQRAVKVYGRAVQH
jgi:hypothetical protein